MASIRLNYESASAKAKTMQANAEIIEKLLTTLVDDMENNINSSTWTGRSAESFRAAWERSSEQFNRFIEYMKSIQSKVDTAAQETKMFDENIN